MSSFVYRLFNGFLPAYQKPSGAGLSLRTTVAVLRRHLLGGASEEAQLAIAAALAKLDRAGVAGANPESWYALAKPTVDSVSDALRLRVSPSEIEAFLECPLHWFIDRIGGSSTLTAGILGSLIHAVLETGDQLDEAALRTKLDSEWRSLEFASKFEADEAYEKALGLLQRGSEYLEAFARSGARLLGAERFAEAEYESAILSGKFDRIELTPDSRIMIADFKTGSKAKKPAEAAENTQLGVYQIMVLAGALKSAEPPLDFDASDTPLAGAKLVQIGKTSSGSIHELEVSQPSLEDNPELNTHFQDVLRTVISGMAWHRQSFNAEAVGHCNRLSFDGSGTSCSTHLIRAVSDV